MNLHLHTNPHVSTSRRRSAELSRRGPIARLAFTITEMLVVVAIIVILTLIAIPAVRSMIKSSESTLAESLLRAAVRAGRDAALRSSEGADGAAVFFFEPGGRTTIVPYVKVGSFVDNVQVGAVTSDTTFEIFAPAPGGQPVSLPIGRMVRGYATIGSIDAASFPSAGWFNGNANITTQRYDPNTGNWVFPETGFFNSADNTMTASKPNGQGQFRNTFMLRFRGGTGEFVSAPADPVLVLAPNVDNRGVISLLDDSSSSTPIRTAMLKDLRLSDPSRYVRTVLARATTKESPTSLTFASTSNNDMRALIGRQSSDMVMARPVSQICLYNESELAAALQLELDNHTGSLYLPAPQDDPKVPDPKSVMYSGPALVNVQAGGGDPSNVVAPTWVRINHWIEGDANGNAQYGAAGNTTLSQIYILDKYTGSLRQVATQRLSP